MLGNRATPHGREESGSRSLVECKRIRTPQTTTSCKIRHVPSYALTATFLRETYFGHNGKRSCLRGLLPLMLLAVVRGYLLLRAADCSRGACWVNLGAFCSVLGPSEAVKGLTRDPLVPS